jgi:hypothetical protein
MGYQLPAWVWPTVLMTVCVLAIWRGRDDERLAAGMDLATWALTIVVFQDKSNATQWPVVAIDAFLFVGLLWIALRSSSVISPAPPTQASAAGPISPPGSCSAT